jgi:hypothetical protein
MEATAVFRIRIGETTSLAHDVTNMPIEKHGVGGQRLSAKLTEGFERGDLEQRGTAKKIDGDDHGIKGRCWEPSMFANSEVLAALVETEAKVKGPDGVEGRRKETHFSVHTNVRGTAKGEILGDESEGLTSPGASVGRRGDAGAARRLGTRVR